MSEVFVLCNQHGAFLSKQREWLSCGDSKTLFRSMQRDELINEKVELTVKSPELRIKIVEAQQEDNGRITVEGQDCLPKAASAPESDEQTELELDTESPTALSAPTTDVTLEQPGGGEHVLSQDHS